VLIRGGTVLDGLGEPPKRSDVRLDGDRVSVVGPGLVAERGEQVVDADGQVVCPGFIDIHTHSDVSLWLHPPGTSKLAQGVTTEVTGNCGFSAFPLRRERRTAALAHLAGIGDDPVDPPWHDLDSYAAAMENRGIGVNIAPLAGHGALRIAAGADRPGPADPDRLSRVLEQVLEQGAFGVSTGLTYAPSAYADAGELEVLCRTVAAFDALYATHGRSDILAGIDEIASVGERTGARLQYSHLAINHPDRWGTADQVVGRLEAARARGVDIAADVYPYDASSSALTQYLPDRLTRLIGPRLLDLSRDPAARRAAVSDIAAGWFDGTPWLWDRVRLARTDGLLGLAAGLTLAEAADQLGVSPAEVTLDLCAQGGHRPQVVLHYRVEADVQTFLAWEWAAMGSDGSAVPTDLPGRHLHPRFFGASARLLGRYVRECGLLTWPEAVRRMTSLPADRLGLSDRGRLLAGAYADIVILDPETVSDVATFDDPHRLAVGINHVIVNGRTAWADCRTHELAGKVLRHG